jgi:hypothetical protein
MADFLYQNKLSDNVAIIEIKKASSKILSEDTYR